MYRDSTVKIWQQQHVYNEGNTSINTKGRRCSGSAGTLSTDTVTPGPRLQDSSGQASPAKPPCAVSVTAEAMFTGD
ncbi:hypothetical protein E2C01_003200 [Portunus trituberculatus]|uniref:Uncharacterized protein n=1 Tax=Portunus trituberculatus TaxID=210409 RepID=A0A5B7CPL0_PORTR|nr:hypothetical protein [Portunus trituberculatus]